MKLPHNVEQQQQLKDRPTKNETGKQAILFVCRKKKKNVIDSINHVQVGLLVIQCKHNYMNPFLCPNFPPFSQKGWQPLPPPILHIGVKIK